MSIQPQEEEEDVSQTQYLLTELYGKTGFDFREYSHASIRRRLQQRMEYEGLPSMAELAALIKHDEGCAGRVIQDLSIRVSGMFRDPGFFRALREVVVPVLRTYPFIRIWHAGCATGQEVYSLAILMREEGLEDRMRIYATDFNEQALETARAGIYPLSEMQGYTSNYLAAGGTRPLSDYYTARFGAVRFDATLTRQVVFAPHDLVTDGSFNEFQLILCRNVLIYFNRQLQARVLTLLHESLVRLGFLGLGQKESLLSSPFQASYIEINPREKIYRKNQL
jgi:chemotaxis protein methyltransferase CheR